MRFMPDQLLGVMFWVPVFVVVFAMGGAVGHAVERIWIAHQLFPGDPAATQKLELIIKWRETQKLK